MVYRLAVILLLGIALYPLARGALDELIAMHNFPLLCDFETPFEVDRWKNDELLVVQEGIARHGDHSLKVRLTTDTYSGPAFAYFPGNWQGFNTLFISIFCPVAEKLELICSIQDKEHNKQYTDRFNRRFVLEKGWNDLTIPLTDIENAPKGRLLNMEQVDNLRLFVVRQEKERVIYIDHLYLGR